MVERQSIIVVVLMNWDVAAFASLACDHHQRSRLTVSIPPPCWRHRSEQATRNEHFSFVRTKKSGLCRFLRASVACNLTEMSMRVDCHAYDATAAQSLRASVISAHFVRGRHSLSHL